MTRYISVLHFQPGENIIEVALGPSSQSGKPDPQVTVDALTAAVSRLVDKLDARPNAPVSPFDWSTPVTHFVDSLPGYDIISLGMILAVVFLLVSSVIIAWSLYKKNNHAYDMLKTMVVPLEAFTAVVQQSAASNELLGRRIEDLNDNLGSMMRQLADSMSQMAAALNVQHKQTIPKPEAVHPSSQRIIRPQS